MLATINWECTKEEATIISAIAHRALREKLIHKNNFEATSMDITACHLNGCPLDLAKLYGASPLDFAHDICGIRRHMDRTTGKLMNFFLPRCSLPEQK